MKLPSQKRENQFTSIKRTESAKLSVRRDIIDDVIVVYHQDLFIYNNTYSMVFRKVREGQREIISKDRMDEIIC